MAEAEPTGGVSGDLERELTCSICTEVLFQPLTLLDCLHTFCGACLKEWFAFQASTATTIHPYTCPACRASVRTTQPNATVTTLLDIFLTANPARGKSEADKQTDRSRYRPGDNVLPKLRRRDERDERDEAEQRMVENAQQLSLQEVGIPSSNSENSRMLEPPRAQGNRDGSRSRSREGRASRHRQRSISRQSVRVIEHQSSLRSLLSVPELDADNLDEDLVRQVLEKLIAEGVDLNQIGLAQEEEITERIADAVRRRQMQRKERRERQTRESLNTPLPSSLPVSTRSARRTHGQSDGGISAPQSSGGPPVSRPGLINAANHGSNHHGQRSSSHGSAQSAQGPQSFCTQSHVGREGPSSPGMIPAPRRRQSDSQQPSRLESRQHFRTSSQTNVDRDFHDIFATSEVATREAVQPSSVSLPLSSTPHHARTYTEPEISCQQCSKEHIEYELHYNCPRCDDGKYNICLNCYRNGKGCKHWFGFGRYAAFRYDQQLPENGYPPDHEQPHILVGHRYRKPPQLPAGSAVSTQSSPSEEDPERRLEAGVFCDICKTFANECYWKCEYCNEGDWGFCNGCINQGRHCTHPLLSVTRTACSNLQPEPGSMSTYETIANLQFCHLPFSTLCNLCRYPIPPSRTRYHCMKCNLGDYDVCISCYHKANVSGRITKEDGSSGWRRCLRGHRMVVVGFEDREDGQRRIVVRDLVGGHALKEEEQAASNTRPANIRSPRMTRDKWRWRDEEGNLHNYDTPLSSNQVPLRYPPDGGTGWRVRATWRYWPEEGDEDELAFPKGAEIREVVNINGDWCLGVYCATHGLFPTNHAVRI